MWDVKAWADNLTHDNSSVHDVLSHFWVVYGWVVKVENIWPDFASTGFLCSYAMVLLTFPLVVFISLRFIWSIAAVGPARKTLSSILVLLFGVPLYPLLTALVLAILWIIMSFAMLAVAIAGSIFVITLWVNAYFVASCDFAEEQREETPVVDDITFWEMICGLIMGIFCMCTFGVLALALTLIKSPIVFLACVCHGVYHTLVPIFKNTGCWCPLAFFGWCFAFVAGVLVLILGILVSALVKLVAAAIWPAYVATGWLRLIGAGGRRQNGNCCSPFTQGMKAGYQVLWAADLLTNTCIYGDFDLLKRTQDEFAEIATGRREQLSPECRKISCLPPVVVGLFQGDWNMAERAIAKKLGVSTDVVTAAWGSLRDQMILVANEGVATGLLSQEYIMEIPPELVFGLPARVLLDTIERSTPGEIALASGMRISESNRPRGKFADKVWDNLQDAINARARMNLTYEQRLCLCGALLAGGGDESELPPGLAKALQDFESLPLSVRNECGTVQRNLIAVALECSREHSFKHELEKVLRSLAGVPESGAFSRLVGGGGQRNRRRRFDHGTIDDDFWDEEEELRRQIEETGGLAGAEDDDIDDESDDDEEEDADGRQGCLIL